MRERIVVGISGGVDSAFAAALLHARGFDVVGCYLKVVVDGAPCPWEQDLPMAHRVAAHLNIPLIVRDVSAEYEREVLEPMVAAYRAGETPNPDAMCNRWVKFDALASVARIVDADRIATGHYARVIRSQPNTDVIASSSEAISRRSHVRRVRLLRRTAPRNDHTELWRGLDHAKDQSYFLWQLTQEQLAMCEFPLGEWKKEDVRAEAKRRGFPNWDRHSTSGVCFLGNADLTTILASRAAATPSTVVTTDGTVLGTVPAGEAMTIGQRAPIAGQSAPRYVVATEPAQHRVVVSASVDDPARFTRTIVTGEPNWIGGSPQLSPLPEGPETIRGREGEREGVQSVLRCTARIRHRQEPQPCTVSGFSPSYRGGARGGACAAIWGEREGVGLRVVYDTPLTGVAPGQAVVFTDGDRVLGGAKIIAAHG